MAGGRVPGAAAAVARSPEHVGQFLARVWGGRAAVNGTVKKYSNLVQEHRCGAGVLGEGSRCCLQSLLAFRFCSLRTMAYSCQFSVTLELRDVHTELVIMADIYFWSQIKLQSFNDING